MMTRHIVPFWICISMAALPAVAAATPSGGDALATVNGEPITLDEFARELAQLHSGVMTPEAGIDRRDPTALLDRLIDIRLILQEAHEIGLGELPEVARNLEAYRASALRGVLFRLQIRDLVPDPERVEKLFRDAVKEVRLCSVLFESEELARSFEELVRQGAPFDEAAEQQATDGLASKRQCGEYFALGSLVPDVVATLESMEIGAISPVVPVGSSFTVIRLEAERFPEDGQARRDAEAAVFDAERDAILREYRAGLKKRFAKVDEELLAAIDFAAAEPGFEALLVDERALVRIEGEEPVTVADLAAALKATSYHGIDRAIESGRLAKKSRQTLEDLLDQRLVEKESARLELQTSDDYVQMVRRFESRFLFDVFVQKVIDPDIDITEDELKGYLELHIGEYSTPEMMRLDALAFLSHESGEAALGKLIDGADFEWTRTHGEGRVDAKETEGALSFGGELLLTSALPPGIREAVEGAASGELRSWAEPDGLFYVLRVRAVISPRPQNYADIRQDLAQKVFAEKREAAIDDWVQKLRQGSEVRQLATAEELDELVGRGPTGQM